MALWTTGQRDQPATRFAFGQKQGELSEDNKRQTVEDGGWIRVKFMLIITITTTEWSKSEVRE
jgi:hypothetical protein